MEHVFAIGHDRRSSSGWGSTTRPAPGGRGGDILGIGDRPYLCYLGRVDEHKGCWMLAEYFARYKERHPGDLALAFVGPVSDKAARASRHRGDRHGVRGRQVGHPGRRRRSWCTPRPTSRSPWCCWRRGRWGSPCWSTPPCAATMEHCRRSGGGLWFDSYRSFEVAVDRLAGDRRTAVARWARPAGALHRPLLPVALDHRPLRRRSSKGSWPGAAGLPIRTRPAALAGGRSRVRSGQDEAMMAEHPDTRADAGGGDPGPAGLARRGAELGRRARSCWPPSTGGARRAACGGDSTMPCAASSSPTSTRPPAPPRGRAFPTICGSGGGRPGSASGSWATWPACWPTSWPPTPGRRPMPRSPRSTATGSWPPGTPFASWPPGSSSSRPGPTRSVSRRPSGRWPGAGSRASGSGRSSGWLGPVADAEAPGGGGRSRETGPWSRPLHRAGRARGGRRAAGSVGVAVAGAARPGDAADPSVVFAEVAAHLRTMPDRQRRRRRPGRVRRPAGPGRPSSGWSSESVRVIRPGRHPGRPGHRPGGLGRGPGRSRPATWPRAGPSTPRPGSFLLRPGRGRRRRSGTGRRRARSTPSWPRSERVSGVHLFVPMLHRHDAVGEHTLALRRPAAWPPGRDVDHLHEIPDPVTADQTRHYLDYESEAAARRRARLPVRHRIGHRRLAGRPAGAGGHQLPQHHPAGVLRPVEQRDHPAAGRRAARAGPAGAAGRAGRRRVRVRRAGAGRGRMPRAPRSSRWPTWPVRRSSPTPTARRPAAGPGRRIGPGHRWLSVGRLAPNKCHHQTIAALFVARMTSDPSARLTVVGAPSEPAYAEALGGYAASLGSGRRRRVRLRHHRRRAGRPLPVGRRAGHAVRARGIRRAPGGGHGPRAARRGLRRRRRPRGARRRRGAARQQGAPAGGRGGRPGCWATRQVRDRLVGRGQVPLRRPGPGDAGDRLVEALARSVATPADASGGRAAAPTGHDRAGLRPRRGPSH